MRVKIPSTRKKMRVDNFIIYLVNQSQSNNIRKLPIYLRNLIYFRIFKIGVASTNVTRMQFSQPMKSKYAISHTQITLYLALNTGDISCMNNLVSKPRSAFFFKGNKFLLDYRLKSLKCVRDHQEIKPYQKLTYSRFVLS